jgi:hypothetical protein
MSMAALLDAIRGSECRSRETVADTTYRQLPGGIGSKVYAKDFLVVPATFMNAANRNESRTLPVFGIN